MRVCDKGRRACTLITCFSRNTQLHADRHMTIFTDDLSERREWLINHQPTITETISMRPNSQQQTQGGKLPAELLSEDEPVTASKTLNPTTNKKKKNRPKKRSLAVANPLSTAKPPPLKTNSPAGTVDNWRPAALPRRYPSPLTAKRIAATRRPMAMRQPAPGKIKIPCAQCRGQRSINSCDHRPTRPPGNHRCRSPYDLHRRDDRRPYVPSRRGDRDTRRHTETTSHFRDGQRSNGNTPESRRQRQSRHNSPSADRKRFTPEKQDRRDQLAQ